MRFAAALLLTFAAFTAQAADTPRVLLETSKGNITLELYPEKAPKTVDNFLKYVRSDFYNGTVFHRVIEDFMIQGGGYDAHYQPRETEGTVPSEADNGLSNERGAIAMARSKDPHSATAQFFINTANNRSLDHKSKTPGNWGYTVFGRVVDGMDVVDGIESMETHARGSMQNVPTEPVIIRDAAVVTGNQDNSGEE